MPRKASRPLVGEIRVPGDKSISHRALIMGALASGSCEFARPNVGHDVLATATALESFGVPCRVDATKGLVKVEGRGWGGLGEPDGVVDAGNSGTTLRLLLGVVAGVTGHFVFTGDRSLARRPMLRVVAPLRQMGASIDGREHGDRIPLAVRGRELTGVDIELPVASAQVKSALLLAGLRASGTTTVSEPAPSRDHSERMLEAFGVEVGRTGSTISVRGGSELQPIAGVIPGDLSSAMFLVAAAVVVPGSDLTLLDVGLNPRRTTVLEVLRSMGAAVEWHETSSSLGEPVGTIRAVYSATTGTEIPVDRLPGLVDEIPALAVVAARSEGETTVSRAGELRVKESDRIAALTSGLRALGADVEELPDGLVVRGPATLTGGEVDAQGDHRIALAFAVAGMVASDRVTVRGWSCVETSFPEFLDLVGEATSKR